MKRHPEIKKINAEVISKARAKVTKRSIRYWFSDVKLYLEEGCLNILNDGRRILNCDETGLQLCPKSGKVLGPRTMSNFYEVVPLEVRKKKILQSYVLIPQMENHYLL